MKFSRRSMMLPLCGALAFALVAGDAPKLKQAAPKVAAKGKVAKAAPLAAPVKVTSVEGITEYRLANGLRVLLFPDASKPTITTNITYQVGSRNENYGETGMAHLLEHLVFKPSKNFSGKDGQPNIVQTLNKVGARFNGT
ncbi:MAG TPA: insulinase family protein, partial [Geothrix sp.]|nr:insulinase family protein [Geothrix sp.]